MAILPLLFQPIIEQQFGNTLCRYPYFPFLFILVCVLGGEGGGGWTTARPLSLLGGGLLKGVPGPPTNLEAVITRKNCNYLLLLTNSCDVHDVLCTYTYLFTYSCTFTYFHKQSKVFKNAKLNHSWHYLVRRRTGRMLYLLSRLSILLSVK